MPDKWTITVKQNVWFQIGICPENFQLEQKICLEKIQLDQIETGRLSAIMGQSYRGGARWRSVQREIRYEPCESRRFEPRSMIIGIC